MSDLAYWIRCAYTAAVWREVGAIVLEVSGAIVALTILSMLVRRKRI